MKARIVSILFLFTMLAVIAAIPVHAFTVTLKAGDGGIIRYRDAAGTHTVAAGEEGVVEVAPGKKVTLTFTPETGFILVAVLRDGVDIGTKKVVLSSKNAPETVEAVFGVKMCELTVTHGGGGDVTPSPARTPCGTPTVLTILPLQHYFIAKIQEGGKKTGPMVARTYEYTTAPVNKKGSISVSFAPEPIITPSAGPGGTISPSLPAQVAPNSLQRFVVTPDPGFSIDSVKLDGKKISPIQGTTDTFEVPVEFKARKVAATFVAKSWTVTASVDGTGGKISPAGTSVASGKKQKFTVTADKKNEFAIKSVTVNGQPVTDIPKNATSYSFTITITGDTTIIATFFKKTDVVTPVTQDYTVLAWNDLGMHCLNPTYDTAVILPPYNNVWAQVVKRGNPPQIVTSGVSVSYRIVNNTSSVNKALFGQFWQYSQKLFGAAPAPDFGLNLEDPHISNTLSGTMVVKGDHFQVNGIPVVPINDLGVKSAYQVVEVTVKDTTGKALAVTTTTVPVSDEIDCGSCHGNTQNSSVAFTDILQKHDLNIGTDLLAATPVLCASCHGSPALGISGPGSSGKTLSQAVHGFHATVGDMPVCYDCHPGKKAKCNRTIQHTSSNGNCITCHGTLAAVASSIAAGRIPWVNEPACATCHLPVPRVDTAATLYRNATGHGGIYCASCHGSPHAMVPSMEATDNAQAIAYQGAARPIGSCLVCHRSNRGGGNNFAEEHVGGKTSACNVCHTGFQNAADFTKWPHQFQWKAR